VDWLTRRETVIALAVLGAVASVIATLPRVRASGLARTLNAAGYALMATSMLLFIVAGFGSG
jgi:hypothetical protein